MDTRLSDLVDAVATLVSRMPASGPLGVMTLNGAVQHLAKQISADAWFMWQQALRKGEA